MQQTRKSGNVVTTIIGIFRSHKHTRFVHVTELQRNDAHSYNHVNNENKH